MNIEEYNKIKNLNYIEYCDYLQKKYGIPTKPYMTPNFKVSGYNKKINSRTSEGLFLHHKYEDHAIMLSHEEFAIKNPFEWQLAENLVYCDYLEHMLLHLLISENPPKDKNKNELVGIGGLVNYIVPELKLYYKNGAKYCEEWRKCCYEKVRNDKELFDLLLNRYKIVEHKYGYDNRPSPIEILMRSIKKIK